MKKLLQSHIVSTGLAIFSMFFGAGNLIYPIMVGMTSGQHIGVGIVGFLITARLIYHLIGLIAMILYDGNYDAFSSAWVHYQEAFIIGICMMIIGPIIAIPRINHTFAYHDCAIYSGTIITTDYTTIILYFWIDFSRNNFSATYRQNKIVDLLVL